MARRLTLLAAAALECCGGPVPTWAQQAAIPLAWEPVPAAEVIDPAQELANTQGQAQPPASQAEAEALVDSLWPSWDDYPPMLRLGPGLPTANLLPAWELDLSLQAISPLAGGGDATGSGNQNIGARLDLGLSESLQVSVFSFIADDPLFAQPVNKSPNPQNGWSAEGGAVQWQVLRNANWSLALAGSLEAFNVRSGGCGNDGVGNCSPNIFNDSGAGVSTDNLVGSLAVPLTWKASRALELTLVPGVSFLPSSQGAGQGGSGTFFGTNVTLGAGAVWRASTQLSLFGSALLPLGPGTNSFDANLNFSRVPIFSGGLRYALNPRMGIEAMLTNGFGGSPATAVLSLPSSNEPLWSARVSWNPGGKDSPPLPFTARSRSLSLGGLTVTTAVVPPAGSFQLWANADSEGNRFGEVAYGLSNDFLLRLVGGAFNAVSPVTPLVPVYAGDNSSNLRLGGKAVLMHQLRGAPFSLALDVSYGRTSTTNQGYTFSQLVATWEANPWLAFNLNPKVSWNGVEVPFGIGLGANLQLGQSFQLIPELNLVTTEAGESNGTLALRWLARRTLAFDLYVSNAAGLLDIGQLLDSDDVRVGSKLTLQF